MLCLVALLIFINLPHFLKIVIPQHDTLVNFEMFYFFYNDFFFSGEIARWLPFGFYGIQADLDLVGFLSPSGLLAIFMGWALRIRDALFLYNLSLLFEQLVLLFGTYLLCERIFTRRLTAFLVTAIVICSTVFTFQLQFNFRIYVYLPLIIFMMESFFSKGRLWWLFLSMAVFALSLFGIGPYLAAVNLLVVSIVFVVFFLFNLGSIGQLLKPSGKDLALSIFFLIVFLSLGALYYTTVSGAFDHSVTFTEGRDSVTLATDLDNYLNYPGHSIGFAKFRGLFSPSADLLVTDLTVHAGIITLPLVIYGLFFLRTAPHVATLAVTLVLAIFSLGSMTPLAEALYHYFPLMKYMRHIGYVVSNFKLFLPILAGFGIERLLLSAPRSKKETSPDMGRFFRRCSAVTGAILFISVYIYCELIMAHVGFIVPYITSAGVASTALILLVLYILSKRMEPARHFKIVLITSVLVSMIAYQGLTTGVFYLVSKRMKPLAESSVSVNKYGFQETRTDEPVSARSRAAMPITKSTVYALIDDTRTVTYAHAHNFLQWEPCASEYRTDYLNENVAALIKARTGSVVPIAEGGITLELTGDEVLRRALGCEVPRLGLTSSVVFATTDEAARMIKDRKLDDQATLILTGVDEALRARWQGFGQGDEGEGSVRVREYSANRLSLAVDVKREHGEWLYFLDAFHPGWRVDVDGKERKIAKADLAFKAVFLEKGTRSVEFVFRNDPAYLVGNLSILTELAFILAIFLSMVCFVAGRRMGER